MGIGWNFPNNNCGQTRGISDAGIETFNGTEIQSLAREICQNSLDAIDENKDNVFVEFTRYIENSKNIPGYEYYSNCIDKAYNYWSSQNNQKATDYLKKAKDQLSAEKTSILRVSDFNTTGLLNPYGFGNDGWNSLTKIDGGSTKSGDKAGAFGIGKNAPFCNSFYRLVFYRTLNKNNEIAAQGISRFISFPEKFDTEKDIRKTMTTGFGYYGDTDENMPIPKIQHLENLCKRTEIGTDVFIYGFNANPLWEKDVICELLENFMMSIYDNKLYVKVQAQRIIDSSNLDYYMEKYKKDIKKSYPFYQTLTSKNSKVFEKDFHGMGTLKLKVLVDYNEKLNRKVLITRTSGMKIFAMDRITRNIPFSGILKMEGEELNAFFREMETPAHDKWEAGRYTKDKKLAKVYLKELKDWITDTILSLSLDFDSEEVDVDGLGGILKKNNVEMQGNENSNKESLEINICELEVHQRDKKSKKGGLYTPNGEKNKGKGGGKKPPRTRTKTTPGTLDPEGEKGGSHVRHEGDGKRSYNKGNYRANPDEYGDDFAHIPGENGSFIGDDEYNLEDEESTKNNSNYIYTELNKVRVIKVSENEYKVSLTSPKSIKKGFIEIVTIGENGKASKLKIKNARKLSGCSSITKAYNKIYFENIEKDKKIAFEFSLFDNRDYAMEVNVYEDK